MYRTPPVYDKPFDTSYLPTCMYKASVCQEDNTAMETITVPAELPKLDDLNLADPATKLALEDVITRQLSMLARLNELEQRLLGVTVASVVKPAPKIDVSVSNDLDLVVHFELDRPPLVFLSVVRLLAISPGAPKVMTSLHLAGELATQRQTSNRVDELRKLLRSIGFKFTTTGDYLSRAQCPLKITLIAKPTTSSLPYAFLRTSEPLVGELTIVIRLLAQLGLPNSNPIWQLVSKPSLLTSERALVEQLSSTVAHLANGRTFIEGGISPTVLDVVLFALAHFSGLTKAATPVSRGIKSLFGITWLQAIQQLLLQG